MIKITFPDGSTKEYEEGVSPADIAKDISQRLYKNSIAAEVNGQLVDLNYSITQDATVKLITLEDDKAPNIYRHTMSHIMAQAVIHVFGKEKVKLRYRPCHRRWFLL